FAAMDSMSSWAGSAASGFGRVFSATVETVKSRDLAADSAFVSSGVQKAYSATIEAVKSRDYVEDTRNAATAVTSGLKSAGGSFKQVSKFGKPIYKHVSGGTLGMKQVNKAGKGGIWKPTWFKGAGSAALTGAVALDAYEIGSAAKQDYDAGTYDKTVVKTASVAGAWAGAIPAAAAGAFALSFIPGVGSLVGGIGGGIVGAVYGARGAEAAAKAVLPSNGNE
ncbi:hypothetical protein PRIPAC_70719, partial [Pristionchus pacificus]